LGAFSIYPKKGGKILFRKIAVLKFFPVFNKFKMKNSLLSQKSEKKNSVIFFALASK